MKIAQVLAHRVGHNARQAAPVRLREVE